MIVYTNRNREPFEIDEDDYEIVSRYTWRIAATYVQTSLRNYGENVRHRYRTVCLHMLLLGPAPNGLQWDHEDRNKMNNKRSNLRAVTRSVNGTNKDISCRIKPGVSGVEGIHWNRDRWVVYLPPTMVEPGDFKRVGRFKNLEEAIAAQTAAIKEAEMFEEENVHPLVMDSEADDVEPEDDGDDIEDTDDDDDDDGDEDDDE